MEEGQILLLFVATTSARRFAARLRPTRSAVLVVLGEAVIRESPRRLLCAAALLQAHKVIDLMLKMVASIFAETRPAHRRAGITVWAALVAVLLGLLPGAARGMLPPDFYVEARQRAGYHLQIRVTGVRILEAPSTPFFSPFFLLFPPIGIPGRCKIRGEAAVIFRAPLARGAPVSFAVDCHWYDGPPLGLIPGYRSRPVEALKAAKFIEAYLDGAEGGTYRPAEGQFQTIGQATLVPRCPPHEFRGCSPFGGMRFHDMPRDVFAREVGNVELERPGHVRVMGAQIPFDAPMHYLVYLLPVGVAWARGHHRRLRIAAVTVLLGWTLIGWLAALLWASCTAARLREGSCA